MDADLAVACVQGGRPGIAKIVAPEAAYLVESQPWLPQNFRAQSVSASPFVGEAWSPWWWWSRANPRETSEGEVVTNTAALSARRPLEHPLERSTAGHRYSSSNGKFFAFFQMGWKAEDVVLLVSDSNAAWPS